MVQYMFGLSHRGVEQFLPCLDCRSSRSSIERDVAAAGQKATMLHQAAPRMRVRVLARIIHDASLKGKSGAW